MQRSGFDSRRYQIFWEVVGLERGPLNLVSTIEELLGRKSSGSDLEIREYGRRDPSRWPRGSLYPQKVGTNFTESGGRSAGIVRSRTQATEFSSVRNGCIRLRIRTRGILFWNVRKFRKRGTRYFSGRTQFHEIKSLIISFPVTKAPEFILPIKCFQSEPAVVYHIRIKHLYIAFSTISMARPETAENDNAICSWKWKKPHSPIYVDIKGRQASASVFHV
jgi:hypothetical protein